jgi:ergothioneine biosynthesis protein EgtC
MCRLLGYLGAPIQLEHLLYKPEHSLIVQSYQPKEMTSGVVNADGLGVGWYHPEREVSPFTYKNTVPIWNDTNLPQLSRYVESGCVLGYVRSATPGQGLDLSNCQPFSDDRLLFIHNGLIENFRKTLYRPIRDRLKDTIYQSVTGTTDSEHIFALLLNHLQASGESDLKAALHYALTTISELAQAADLSFSANCIVSNGHNLVVSRHAVGTSAPSLYWLRDDPMFPNAVIIASEPLFASNWHSCPNHSILSVGEDLDIHIDQIT